MKFNFFFIVFFLLTSCHKPGESLEKALKESGHNRPELEKILDYYSRCPSDSLKLKAAVFLITQMSGHYGLNGAYIKNYIKGVDSLNFINPVRQALQMTIYQFPKIAGTLKKEEDLKYIQADYLIPHINHVFELWAKAPWLESFPFEDFCEFLLPYRVGNELLPIKYCSVALNEKDIRPYLEDYDDTKTSVNNLSRAIVRRMSDHIIKGGKRVVLPMIGNYELSCYDEALQQMFIYRKIGVPVALDYTPFWASSDGGHCWAAPIDLRLRDNSVLQTSQRNVAKVYRKTFSHHPVFDSTVGEYIPPLFTDPFLLDVTDEYVQTSDIHISFQFKPRMKYTYLAVFNGRKWQPIAGSRGRDFVKMGRDVVYLPVSYLGKKQVNLSYPFILNAAGKVQYLVPDTTIVQKLHLLRKYPAESRKEIYNYWTKGTRIEVSNDVNFEKRDTVLTFDDDPAMKFCKIKCMSEKSYQYVRVIPGRFVNVAEIAFYDSLHCQIKGKWTSKNTYNMNFAYDGDPLTSARVISELKCDFGKPFLLSEITFLPCNDGNGIFPDQVYELLYMGRDGWISYGMKTADDYYIEFDNVPSGALYWLRNRTMGKEERIFTYVNGRVKFW